MLYILLQINFSPSGQAGCSGKRVGMSSPPRPIGSGAQRFSAALDYVSS